MSFQFLGGLLQYGIPTMKLSKDVVKRRVDLMAAEGIVFKTNVNVGKDIPATELLNNFDALLLTTGATWPRDLPLPNRDLNGIHFAMEFLESGQKKQLGSTKPNISAEGKDVLIIGGGDTGCDCIATSLRQGAKTITSFEILPDPPKGRADDNPWPQWPKVFRVDYGHEEVRVKFGKDPRQYSTTTKEFLSDGNGNIKGVNTVQVAWTQSPTGQWSMKEVPGTEKYYPADLILLAMGFLGPEKPIVTELGLEMDNRGNVKAVNSLYGSSMDKVFAAGGNQKISNYLPLHFFNVCAFFWFRLSSWSITGCMGHHRGTTSSSTNRFIFNRWTKFTTRSRWCYQFNPNAIDQIIAKTHKIRKCYFCYIFRTIFFTENKTKNVAPT